MLSKAANSLLLRARQLVEQSVAGGETGLDMILLSYKDGRTAERLISEDFSPWCPSTNDITNRLVPETENGDIAVACILTTYENKQAVAIAEESGRALLVGSIGWEGDSKKVKWENVRLEGP